MHERELWAIEKELWTAGEDVFEQRLDAGAIMVCPAYGSLPRQAFLDVVRQQPCSEWARLTDTHSYSPFPDVAVLAYNVHAIKEGSDYHAHCSSTYVRINGNWLLAMHHQSQLAQQPQGEGDDLLQSSLAARIFRPLMGRLTMPESVRNAVRAAPAFSTDSERDAQRAADAALAAFARSRQA